jgi:8-oxo-dGTP pyrophosphatase MutT (NUDIX family)
LAPRPRRVDLAWQLTYRLGYRAALAWWRLRRPAHHGAVVAVWLDGMILGVTQSYTDRLSWPGGGIRRGEEPVHAAQRELREEIALDVRQQDLTLVATMTDEIDYRHDHVRIFELHLTAPPMLTLDAREIIHAAFMRPQDMLAAKIPIFARRYLLEREGRPG